MCRTSRLSDLNVGVVGGVRVRVWAGARAAARTTTGAAGKRARIPKAGAVFELTLRGAPLEVTRDCG